MRSRKKLTYAQKNALSTTGLYVQRARMLKPGARIGLAVSGGIDSFSMLQIMLERRRKLPFPVELMVLHLNPGFVPDNHAPLVDWVRKRGVPAHFELTEAGPRAHSPENRKRSACFYCAMLRRTRLFELCRHYRLSHLAFGHTAEDLVATFFMNIFNTGKVDGLSGRALFFGGELEVIRPVLLCEKSVLRRAAAAWNLPIVDNPCPSSGTTSRDAMLDWLATGWGQDRRIRKNVYNAVTRLQLDLDSHMP
jgi:tRNA(Ile)-lysidine synthase TilS/MesJ